jgi:hypothetical protein
VSTQPPQPQMDVLYMKNYGHVLGIFTRNAAPSQMEATADSFLGQEGFHLRGLTTTAPLLDFLVPANLIAAFQTNFDPTALASPLDYVTDSFGSTPPTTVHPASNGAVTVTVSPLKITPPATASGTILVVIAVPGAAPAQILPIPIPTPVAPIKPTLLGLDPGTNYFAVVFVPGSPIAVSASFPG